MVYNLPMETTLLPIYSKNTIIFLCIRYSVSLFQNSNRSVIIIFFFPKSFDDLVLLAKKLQSISQPHSARQFKGTGTLLVGSTIGNKMWYNTDGKKKKKINLLLTVLKLKQDLVILTRLSFAAPLTHACHYLQSCSPTGLNTKFCQFPCCTSWPNRPWSSYLWDRNSQYWCCKQAWKLTCFCNYFIQLLSTMASFQITMSWDMQIGKTCWSLLFCHL